MLTAALEVAEQQLGLITLAQALACGLSERTIRSRLAAGIWLRCQPGVYAIAGAPASEDRSLLAACLCAGRVVAVSHRSAAARWGLDKLSRARLLDVSVDRERGVRVEGVVLHRSRDLRPEHIVRHGPLPITTPARTLVDLGQVAPWYVVRDLLELLISRRVLTANHAHAALELHSRRGRNGCGALRRVLEQRALLDRPTDSVLESAFADLCLAYGLPVAQFQHHLVVDGHDRFIDFAYPTIHLAIEVDGFEHHATLQGFIGDRIRGNELALHGWTVLHFTWQQVIHQPGYVAEIIERALAQRVADTGHQNDAEARKQMPSFTTTATS
jgi:very-short-patch-repair endonuclease